LPNTVSFALRRVPGHLLVLGLDNAGFAVSTGAVRPSGKADVSHVLLAMGYSQREAAGSVRVSLGWSNTMDEVDRFLQAVPEVVEKVRDHLALEEDGR
jgi:cysteine desulfurase